MIVVWLKFFHVASIALWSAGLIALPFLYRERPGLRDGELYRLHSFTRAFYIRFVSPGAFVAIGTGTALILLQETYANWFSAKLLAVAAMTGIHIFSGLAILRIFERTGRFHTERFFVMLPATIAVVTAILVLVLGKPELQWPEPLTQLLAPGALREIASSLTDGWIS